MSCPRFHPTKPQPLPTNPVEPGARSGCCGWLGSGRSAGRVVPDLLVSALCLRPPPRLSSGNWNAAGKGAVRGSPSHRKRGRCDPPNRGGTGVGTCDRNSPPRRQTVELFLMIWICCGALPSLLLTLIMRRGLILTVFGVVVVTRAGILASRLRASWRECGWCQSKGFVGSTGGNGQEVPWPTPACLWDPASRH